jgi:hypothetical protein
VLLCEEIYQRGVIIVHVVIFFLPISRALHYWSSHAVVTISVFLIKFSWALRFVRLLPLHKQSNPNPPLFPLPYPPLPSPPLASSWRKMKPSPTNPIQLNPVSPEKNFVRAGRTRLGVRTPTRRHLIGSEARRGRAARLLSLALRGSASSAAARLTLLSICPVSRSSCAACAGAN